MFLGKPTVWCNLHAADHCMLHGACSRIPGSAWRTDVVLLLQLSVSSNYWLACIIAHWFIISHCIKLKFRHLRYKMHIRKACTAYSNNFALLTIIISLQVCTHALIASILYHFDNFQRIRDVHVYKRNKQQQHQEESFQMKQMIATHLI